VYRILGQHVSCFDQAIRGVGSGDWCKSKYSVGDGCLFLQREIRVKERPPLYFRLHTLGVSIVQTYDLVLTNDQICVISNLVKKDVSPLRIYALLLVLSTLHSRLLLLCARSLQLRHSHQSWRPHQKNTFPLE
jgi:hypothetical protein